MRTARPLALALLAALVVAACSRGEAPGWTYAPAPSPTPIASTEPSPGASAAPSAAPDGSTSPSEAPGDTVVLDISAQNVEYDTDRLDAPADTPFQIRFANNDAGVPHNVEIRDAMGMSLWQGEIFNGVETRVYDVPALPAGTYTFICTVHPNMVGELIVG